jgi:hypothetical protein
MHMTGQAVPENVRRYRAIASLYRQTAALRPLKKKWSVLAQAEEWEHRAVLEREAYFEARDKERAATCSRNISPALVRDVRWVPSREGFGGPPCDLAAK